MDFEINKNLMAVIIFGGFALLWIGFLTLLGKATGWAQLYTQLGSHDSPQIIGGQKKVYRFVSGYVNKSHYKNFLKVITTPYSLSIIAYFPYSFGHKTLIIPWEKINFIKEEKTIFYNTAILKLKAPINTELKLPKGIFVHNEHVPARL
jgi:hypothetical protein